MRATQQYGNHLGVPTANPRDPYAAEDNGMNLPEGRLPTSTRARPNMTFVIESVENETVEDLLLANPPERHKASDYLKRQSVRNRKSSAQPAAMRKRK